MTHHTTLEQHIEEELAHGEEQEEFVDPEYLSSQCPNCKIVFPTDEEMLAHVCLKEDKWEY